MAMWRRSLFILAFLVMTMWLTSCQTQVGPKEKPLANIDAPIGGSPSEQGGSGNTSGRDTTVNQFAGSAWAVVTVVIAYLWLSNRKKNRRQEKNIKATAAAIGWMGASEQRDRLLESLENHLPYRKVWDRAIGNFRVKRSGHDRSNAA